MLALVAAVAPWSAAAASPATPAAHTIEIKGFAFVPKSLTIAAGESVRFVNEDEEAHTATAEGGAFDSGGLDTNDSWSFVFKKPGRYAYFCTLHPYMKGVIVVKTRGM